MVALHHTRLSLIRAVARHVRRDEGSEQGMEQLSTSSQTDCLVHTVCVNRMRDEGEDVGRRGWASVDCGPAYLFHLLRCETFLF